jgi:hypothetical protein
MGQRLNIEIKNNDRTLANAYYHWSGYTESSLELTEAIINYIKKNEIKPDVESAIKLLEHTGATFNESAWNDAVSEGIVSGKLKKCDGRNAGLIGVTQGAMKETRSWEEGRIEINIENNTFDFKCAFKKDYIEDDDIWELIKHKFYRVTGIDKSWQIPFNNINLLINGVKEAQENFNGRFCFEYNSYNSIY